MSAAAVLNIEIFRGQPNTFFPSIQSEVHTFLKEDGLSPTSIAKAVCIDQFNIESTHNLHPKLKKIRINPDLFRRLVIQSIESYILDTAPKDRQSHYLRVLADNIPSKLNDLAIRIREIAEGNRDATTLPIKEFRVAPYNSIPPTD